MQGVYCCLGSTSVVKYFLDSNFSGQVIVFVLILCSFVAWTVMVGKYLELKRLEVLNASLREKLHRSERIDAYKLASQYEGPFGECLRRAIQGIGYWFERENGSKYREEGAKSKMINYIENSLFREFSMQQSIYESKMTLLGTIVTGAPFLGLLGTVWGVMDAFGSIGASGVAQLQSLAPGVSGALLTTVAALLVAIPSVFGYNFLVSKAKQMTLELENFVSILLERLEIEFE